MHIHLVIIQPDDYVHSLCFLDTADYLRYWLERSGVPVSMGKNRLRHDAINIVFGAHLGFHPQWLEPRYRVVFFNLEQIGLGGLAVSPTYQALLRSGPVIDYHPLNVASYRADVNSVPLVPFLNAPYLNPSLADLDLSKRPIDLMFFGSINSERRAFLKRVEKAGWDVAVFDTPTYYHERDAYVSQAKAVLNTSFYESARFEQVRAFNVLSQGTALINFLQPGQKWDPLFKDPVFWIDDASFDHFFKERFAQPDWYVSAHEKFKHWCVTDPTTQVDVLIDHLGQLWKSHDPLLHPAATPRQIVQSEGGRYYQDALNISPYAVDEADLTIDLCEPQKWPWSGASRWGQNLEISPGQIQLMVMRHWPDNPLQWRALLANSMTLLCLGGQLRVEISTAHGDFTSDPSFDLRAAEKTWHEFTDQFWKSGLLTERLSVNAAQFLDEKNNPVDRELAFKVILTFQKTATSLSERTQARVQSPNFGLRPSLKSGI